MPIAPFELADVILQGGEDIKYVNVHVGLGSAALDPRPHKQYWCLVGLRGWDSGADPYPTAPTTLAQFNTQWAGHQKIGLKRGVERTSSGERIARRNFFALPRLRTARRNVVARFAFFPREVLSTFKLPCVDTILSAREGETAGTVILFGTPGHIYSFNGTTLTLVKNLSDPDPEFDATSADAVAVLGDKIYLANNNKLQIIDSTYGDSGYEQRTLRDGDGVRDTREVKFVERAGDTIVVLSVDAELSTKRTQAYYVKNGNVKPAWQINEAVTLTNAVHVTTGTGPTATTNSVLQFAAGPKLYQSENLATRTLVRTFGADITSLSSGLVGLENGEVWRVKVDGTWLLETTLADPVVATAHWLGVMSPFARGVAAIGTDNTLREQDTDGSWGAGHVVENTLDTADVVTNVTGLRRQALGDLDSMLVLTGEDGLLVQITVSPLSEERGAVAVSNIDSLSLTPGGLKELV